MGYLIKLIKNLIDKSFSILAIAVFIGMAILPATETIFRFLPFKSLTASQVIVQHLVMQHWLQTQQELEELLLEIMH